jgi:hypothetical protein
MWHHPAAHSPFSSRIKSGMAAKPTDEGEPQA